MTAESPDGVQTCRDGEIRQIGSWIIRTDDMSDWLVATHRSGQSIRFQGGIEDEDSQLVAGLVLASLPNYGVSDTLIPIFDAIEAHMMADAKLMFGRFLIDRGAAMIEAAAR